MISRILYVCLLAVAIAGSGCDEATLRAREEHVLNRIGYGPDAWSRQRIRQLGIDAYVEEQLYPSRLDDSGLEGHLRAHYPVLGMSLASLRSSYDGSSSTRAKGTVRRQLAEAKLLRAIYSKRQLEQVLVDFWLNHFNVDARRELATWGIVPYERDVIRPHVLGRFEDMLRAVARHPAMLEYLDNAQSFREGFEKDRRVWGINENFARELLELHTVGPRANQTLGDIRNTALAFTGWTVADDLRGSDGRGFVFLADGHDRTAKRILDLSLPAGGGIGDGNAVISYLARHPSTATHIAQKLCRRFVAEQATGCELAASLRFLVSGGDLRQVMREILRSQDFRDPRYSRSKVKRPLHHVASIARAVGLTDDFAFANSWTKELANLGEELYCATPPSGWPDESRAWLGEGSLVRRWQHALLAAGGLRGVRPPKPLAVTDPEAMATAVIDRLLLGGARGATRSELVRHLLKVDRDVRLLEATTLVLSSPDFSHH
jgi:uncharacterized protein (DUF1800 family)